MTSAVDNNEVDRFSAIAGEWWDPKGKFRPLHQLNPARLAFLREEILLHFGRDGRSPRPFSGLKILDIGCGGGLISEPLCRLGASVTGLDPSEDTIAAARVHAETQALGVDYVHGTAEALAEAGATFDVVIALEVIEHVPDVPAFLATCAKLLRPGGLVLVSTLNRTARSYLLGIVAAEYVLGWLPRGTHDWHRFVPPDELANMLSRAGLNAAKAKGMSFNPLAGQWTLGDDCAVNYLMRANRPSA